MDVCQKEFESSFASDVIAALGATCPAPSTKNRVQGRYKLGAVEPNWSNRNWRGGVGGVSRDL